MDNHTWNTRAKKAVKQARDILAKYLEEEEYSLKRHKRFLPSRVHETLAAQTEERISRLRDAIIKIDQCG